MQKEYCDEQSKTQASAVNGWNVGTGAEFLNVLPAACQPPPRHPHSNRNDHDRIPFIAQALAIKLIDPSSAMGRVE